MIPAGTNVSNAMVVFLTQSDNKGRRNYFGYDKIMLIGFDYSWTYGGKYYAFDEDGNGKANYMRHIYLKNRKNEDAYTSTNLHFSAQWLEQYLRNFNLPVVQCDESTLLGIIRYRPLTEQIGYKYKIEDQKIVRQDMLKRDKLKMELNIIEDRLNKIGVDHFNNFQMTT